MAYKLKNLKGIEDFSYTNEVKALLKLLTTTWDISAAPKGYAEFMKGYQDYQGMDELEQQEEALLKSFKGHCDGTVGSDCLVIKLTKEHVGYVDRNQINGGPLEALISALLTHGIVLGQRLGEIEKKSEPYKRIDQIKHTYTMSGIGVEGYEEPDPEISRLYLREFEALLNLDDPRTLREIEIAFESERRKLERSRFLVAIDKKVKETPTFIAYNSEDKDIHYLWGYMHGETGSEKRYTEFLKDMDAIGISIHRDKDVFHVNYTNAFL